MRGEIGKAVPPCYCIVVVMSHFAAENGIFIAAIIFLINLYND